MNEKFDGRLTAPLAEILFHKVALGVLRGREPEGRRGSIPTAALDAADVLLDAGYSALTVLIFPEIPEARRDVAAGKLNARAEGA